MGTILPLSNEQELFIERALDGHNILVDACIGSGKTTAIQELCNRYDEDKNILYLTYNKLLKLDAKEKIKNKTVTITNYHGFAYMELRKANIKSGINELIQIYNANDLPVDHYDVLILDEYQDIEQESAEMLEHIKKYNPKMQIIAVGDMEQKIYDKTRLNVESFIVNLLGKGYDRLEFTLCFRISHKLAEFLGDVWHKKIVGVNKDCRVLGLTFDETEEFLLHFEPKDILCLGQNMGKRSEMLNRLEDINPQKFNKYTIWSNTTDNDSGATQPTPNCAVFTTFDGCKGMERDVCVVFDWTEAYWSSRTSKPNAKYEIIRNIFCVAASRGKKYIVFVDNDLKKRTLLDACKNTLLYDDMQISTMFDFKYIEDVESAFQELDVKEIQSKGLPIPARISDGMIDLSSCIGIYQEAAYFNHYNIIKDINQFFQTNRDKEFLKVDGYEDWDLEQQILYLVALETNQDRYMKQVSLPLVSKEHWQLIKERLSSHFTPDERVQVNCPIPFADYSTQRFVANGLCDVLKEREDKKGNAVYELKFVSELSHVHFLQCACYMVAMNLEIGYLWNIYDNQMYEIKIPSQQAFMDKVSIAVTKGAIKKYRGLESVRPMVHKKKKTKSRPKVKVKAKGKAVAKKKKCV